jgi:hypothetical protein
MLHEKRLVYFFIPVVYCINVVALPIFRIMK